MAAFTFELQLTVKNEENKKPMFVPHEMVNGTPFIKVHKKCNVLCNLCNQLKGMKYFAGVDVFQYLMKLRNDKVSYMIKDAQMQDDPFAEQQAGNEEVSAAKERLELFRKFKIPEVITISTPSFEINGNKREPLDLKVLATAKLTASVEMEAISSNIEWLKDACLFTWMPDSSSSPCKRAADSSWILPSKIKVNKDDDESLVLFVNYKRANGAWTKKHMRLNKDHYETPEDFQVAVRKMVSRMESFIEENHFGDCGEDDA